MTFIVHDGSEVRQMKEGHCLALEVRLGFRRTWGDGKNALHQQHFEVAQTFT